MNENGFEPKIEGVKKDDAEKIVNYRNAQMKMKEFLEKTHAGDNTPEEFLELDPFKLKEKTTITSSDIEKVGDIVKKSQDKELVEKLTVGLEEEKKELRKKEIENLISELNKEVERIENKLKDYKEENLSEEIKKVLEKDRQEIEKLKAEIKNLKNELEEL